MVRQGASSLPEPSRPNGGSVHRTSTIFMQDGQQRCSAAAINFAKDAKQRINCPRSVHATSWKRQGHGPRTTDRHSQAKTVLPPGEQMGANPGRAKGGNEMYYSSFFLASHFAHSSSCLKSSCLLTCE